MMIAMGISPSINRLGGTVSAGGGVYATWSTLYKGPTVALSNNNLTATGSGLGSCIATVGKSTGKWYWELTPIFSGFTAGLGSPGQNLADYVGADAFGLGWYYPGSVITNAAASQTAASYSVEVLGFALNADSSELQLTKGGTIVLYLSTPLGKPFYPAVSVSNGGAGYTANFGATPFAYTPPAGYSGLTA